MARWALVTGAARRLGRSLAVAAAQAGYDVVIHHRRSEGDAGETLRLVEAAGREGRMATADLADPRACARLVAEAPGPLGLLVNSAAIFGADTAQTFTVESLDAHWGANLRAPVLLSQAFAAALPAHETGLIVNIIDQRVWRLTPLHFTYTLSKMGLWAATRTLAQALAPRIRVNAIGPGPTLLSAHQDQATFEAESAAVPLGRGARPDEIGAALAYLIGAASVTGQMIAVDGGQHLAWRTPDVGPAR